MTSLIAIAPDDVPVDDIPPNVDDTAPLRCEHEGCQNTLTYGGRGRRPKWCAEHKPSPGTGTGSKRASGWQKADAVEANLTKLLNWTAAGITFINPKDGAVIAKGGPAVAHELVELARLDKRYRQYLEWLAAPGKYGPLSMATAAIVIPIMANHGLLPQFIIPIIEAEQSGGGNTP